MLQKMKTVVKQLLAKTGYQITKLQNARPKASSEDNKVGTLQFGPYKVESHCKHQIENYASNPTVNQFIGRLAGLINDIYPEQIVIDVGANCGDTAALMRSYSKAPILCIEGDVKLFALVKKNLAHMPGVDMVNSYLGEFTGALSAKLEKEGWNSTLIPSNSSDATIDLIQLDDLKHPWLLQKTIGLIKVDAEGFDIAILFGARGLLGKCKPIITFEYNRENMDVISEPGLRVFPYLESLGYDALMVYDCHGRYLLSTNVGNLSLLRDLHAYIRPWQNKLYYLDMVVFPKDNANLFERFVANERTVV